MHLLLVTEKCSSNPMELDGGARLVQSLQNAFGDKLKIMQFGSKPDPSATWHFDYPSAAHDRFVRRLENARFIAEKVKSVEHQFSHAIFIHLSMQFGLASVPLREGLEIWTFPMFMTPSYEVSGEKVPQNYFEMEQLTLRYARNLLTPSHWEKRQLMETYSVPMERIHVIPRGVDRRYIRSQERKLTGPPIFCSIGSIKPQKNTLGLIRLFHAFLTAHHDAKLKIIGPVQNSAYGEDVRKEIDHLRLKEKIEMLGYVHPRDLASVIEDAHLHLSESACETFGRSIFETLAAGLPNVANRTGNAAADYLSHLSYACFTDDTHEKLRAIDRMLDQLPQLSHMALEVGQYYDDVILSRLLAARICSQEIIAISDFDGTLFHKNDPIKTLQAIEAFRSYPIRVLCSARKIHDLLDQMNMLGFKVDWIIGCSGSIVTDGAGNKLWQIPIDEKVVTSVEVAFPQAERLTFDDAVLQLAVPEGPTPLFEGLRVEVYQGTAFLSHWEASKFRAVHRLLQHIQWSGKVAVFGDGPYDAELITYFDGTMMTGAHFFKHHSENERVNV